MGETLEDSPNEKQADTIGTDVPVERGESASVQTRRECFSESGRQKKT